VRGARDPPNEQILNRSGGSRQTGTGVFTKLGLVQGQLKARRKELAERPVFTYHFERPLRRPATAH
jgi:hypothetical protein